jgi:hypothetical protein
MKKVFQTLALAAALAALAAPARATIYGTMSNFDVFNDTPQDSYGAELELEGVHSADVYNTYPSHYDHRTVTEYSDGVNFGTRVTFTGYNFTSAGYIPPTPGQSTNGHMCVNTQGCEHFGFAVSTQPSATRYFWLDSAGQRIGTTPLAVPTPTWTYYPTFWQWRHRRFVGLTPSQLNSASPPTLNPTSLARSSQFKTTANRESVPTLPSIYKNRRSRR